MEQAVWQILHHSQFARGIELIHVYALKWNVFESFKNFGHVRKKKDSLPIKEKAKNPKVVQHWVSQMVFSILWNTEYVPFKTSKEIFWQQNTWTSKGE